jgi:hypothetical protein
MEQTVPYTKEIEIVLRNPEKKEDTFSYFIDVECTDFNIRWIDALKHNLKNNFHLEKNYCWMGFADSPRDADYLCQKINEAIFQINCFNLQNEWTVHGLSPYPIDDHFSRDKIIVDDLKLNHGAMNRLHRYFEELQGTVGELSPYYRLADHETKWAIRQLNDLCHELESWVLSNRKKHTAPEWQRPSQITTFLNAPRYNLQQKDYELFLKNRYDRVIGGVYLHWAQIGKTHLEVFRDEQGKDIDSVTCSAITCLQYYSGEFDVEWGRDVVDNGTHKWHSKEQYEFREWLKRNNINYDDPKLSFGYIKLGQVNLHKSFGTLDFQEILSKLSSHLDIYKIIADGVCGTFDYVWSDHNYKQMQIDFLRPGYDWSKSNA